jgi:DNA-binding phage protein
MKKSTAYQPDLIESLRDAGEAKEYLNAALEEDDPELFLLALRNVAEAQGGVGQLAEKASTRCFQSVGTPNSEVSMRSSIH